MVRLGNTLLNFCVVWRILSFFQKVVFFNVSFTMFDVDVKC